MIDKATNKINQINCPDCLYHRTWNTAWENNDDRIRLNFVIKQVEGKSVMDIGAGDGIMSIELGRLGKFVCGVNINPTELGQAREHLSKEQDYVRKNVIFVQEDIESYFPMAKYDNIICSEMLEHTVVPEDILGKIHMIATATTKIIITVPNRLVNQGSPRWELPGIHIQEFTKDRLKNMLDKHFKDITFHNMYDPNNTKEEGPFIMVTCYAKKSN